VAAGELVTGTARDVGDDAEVRAGRSTQRAGGVGGGSGQGAYPLEHGVRWFAVARRRGSAGERCMIVPHGVEIFVATEPVDMRLGFERLGGVVRERMK